MHFAHDAKEHDSEPGKNHRTLRIYSMAARLRASKAERLALEEAAAGKAAARCHHRESISSGALARLASPILILSLA